MPGRTPIHAAQTTRSGRPNSPHVIPIWWRSRSRTSSADMTRRFMAWLRESSSNRARRIFASKILMRTSRQVRSESGSRPSTISCGVIVKRSSVNARLPRTLRHNWRHWKRSYATKRAKTKMQRRLSKLAGNARFRRWQPTRVRQFVCRSRPRARTWPAFVGRDKRIQYLHENVGALSFWPAAVEYGIQGRSNHLPDLYNGAPPLSIVDLVLVLGLHELNIHIDINNRYDLSHATGFVGPRAMKGPAG